MPEVFTISGAPLGYDAVSQAIALDRKRAAAARGASATASAAAANAGASPAVRLQNALVALGNTRGDSTLIISIDGVIGPGTVKAVNYALRNVVGAGPAQRAGLSGRFLNATATKGDVQNYAATLAQVFTQAVQSAGGTVPAPPNVGARAKASRVSPEAITALTQPDDGSSGHPALPWVIGGAALLVAALGFMASRKRAAAA